MSTQPVEVREIPYAPRKWAKKLHASFRRNACVVLHRRAGKTTAILNHHVRAATNDDWERARLKSLLPDLSEKQLATLLKRRVYWHVMPTFKQGKLTGAWDILKEITRPIEGRKPNESEMSVTFENGSKVQIIGADDPDSLRGPGLSGLSLDEYSQIPSNAFGEVLSKALGDHLGYAIFSGTIKGKDQLYLMYQQVKNNPEWFALWQDITGSLETEAGATIETLRRNLQDDRKHVKDGLMTQAEFDQEWFLSMEAAIKGAIYGTELALARKAGRITRVPFDPMLPVDTDWDIGFGDATAIWFSQSLRSGEVRLIDYYENSGEALPHYARMLKGDLPVVSGDQAERDKIEAANVRRRQYVYGTHWAPWDFAATSFETGKSRMESAKEHGFTFKQTPRLGKTESGEVEDGINAARLLLARCWFDEDCCDAGLEALRWYRRDFNKRLDEFKAEPVHDWASHGADAFRGLAVRHKVPQDKKKQAQASFTREYHWT